MGRAVVVSGLGTNGKGAGGDPVDLLGGYCGAIEACLPDPPEKAGLVGGTVWLRGHGNGDGK